MYLPDPGRSRCVNQRPLMYTCVLIPVMTALIHTCSAEYSSSTDNQERTQRHIRIATLQADPFVRLNWSPGLIANERYEGLYIDLLKELAHEVGFGYQLYLVPDGRTGLMGDNGHWNGLVGELERGSADLVLAPVVATDERRHVIHFLSPLSRVKLSLLSRDHHRQRHLPYGIVLNSEEFYAIKSDTQLYNSLKAHGVTYTTSIMEALDKAREGECNLLLSTQLADYHSDQEPCDLTAEPFHIFDDLVYSLATREHSVLSDEISSALDRLMIGTSVMDRLGQRWLRGACMRRGTLPTSIGTTTNADARRLWNKLTITSVVTEPYLMRSSKRGVEFEGYIADLIRQMAQVLSIDYEWIIQRRVGRRKSDGTWTGMIGDLMDGTADLAAAPFVVSDDQEQILSLSKPFLESTLSLLVKSTGDGNPHTIMVEDLLNHSEYDFGVVHKSRLAKQLRHSQIPIYKQLWRKLKDKDRNKENRIHSIRDGLHRVREGNFALILESPEATYLASLRPCDLLSVSQYMVVTNYAFATRRDSPLMDHLNLALLQLQEQGILQALFHKWWNTDECVGIEHAFNTTQTQPTQNMISTTTMTPTTTRTTTPSRFQPILDFDLDALLGLSTDMYQYADNESDYGEIDDSQLHDLERIFLTSPISPITPRKSDKNSTAQRNDELATAPPLVNMSLTTSTLFGIASTEPPEMTLQKDMSDNTTVITPSKVKSQINTNITRITYTASHLPYSTTISASTTRKHRRKGRKRRPGRRKGRKRLTTPSLTTASTAAAEAITTQPIATDANKPRDFDRNFDWFFVTELPRPEEYDDYDSFNISNGENLTSLTPHIIPPSSNVSSDDVTTDSYKVSNTTHRQKETTEMDTITLKTTSVKNTLETTIDTIDIQTNSTVNASVPSAGQYNTAVLVVVIIHLVIFGWPTEPVDCTDNCHR